METDSESLEKDSFKELYIEAITHLHHSFRPGDILSAKNFPKNFGQKVALVF